jgi:hypothetical protein
MCLHISGDRLYDTPHMEHVGTPSGLFVPNGGIAKTPNIELLTLTHTVKYEND